MWLLGAATHPRTHPAACCPAQGFLYNGQAGIQVLLVLVALVAVPWMLVPKPYILKQRHEAAQRAVSHCLGRAGACLTSRPPPSPPVACPVNLPHVPTCSPAP